MDGIEPDSPLVLAAALDPHFKSLKFLIDDLKQSVREKLSQLKDADCGNPNFHCVAVNHLKLYLQKRKNSIGYIVRTRR